ncbi:hypothetical protein PMAG_a2494 [Pseudoalteromonas mariniglutinosa NCIMB 1770]|nr:hypothetical protein [Pseudoalteromonas mariniglutinosa NCIMB 1770]
MLNKAIIMPNAMVDCMLSANLYKTKVSIVISYSKHCEISKNRK